MSAHKKRERLEEEGSEVYPEKKRILDESFSFFSFMAKRKVFFSPIRPHSVASFSPKDDAR